MDLSTYRAGSLYGEAVSLAAIAEVVGGPPTRPRDLLAKDPDLPRGKGSDRLAIMSAGAYEFSQSSNDDSRPRAAEVPVEGGEYTVVRRRESYEDLVAGESIL